MYPTEKEQKYFKIDYYSISVVGKTERKVNVH